MKVVIAGGGTAGHVNPALALARALSSDEVIFAGTTRGAEATLVPQAGYELEIIEVRGFDRSKPTSIVSTGAQALRATKQASCSSATNRRRRGSRHGWLREPARLPRSTQTPASRRSSRTEHRVRTSEPSLSSVRAHHRSFVRRDTPERGTQGRSRRKSGRSEHREHQPRQRSKARRTSDSI